MIQRNWLIGETKSKWLLYKYVMTGFWIPWSVIIFLWSVVLCLQFFFFSRNRGRSILFTSGTIRKDSFIKNGSMYSPCSPVLLTFFLTTSQHWVYLCGPNNVWDIQWCGSDYMVHWWYNALSSSWLHFKSPGTHAVALNQSTGECVCHNQLLYGSSHPQ